MGGFEWIRERVIKGAYYTQFDFDQDLNSLVSKANDGHLQIGLCSQEIFRFQHNEPLVSFSDDGIEIPHLYTYRHALLKYRGRTGAISPVVEINGIEANYYLQSRTAARTGYQDPDARYNAMFPSAAPHSWSVGSWTTRSGLWPGTAGHTLTFKNGTRLEIHTTASWPMTNGAMNFSSGEEIFNAACVPNSDSKYVFGSYPGMFLASPGYDLAPGGMDAYPKPTMSDPSGLVRGFYFDDTFLGDVCVLRVSGFHSGERGSQTFSNVIRQFLKQAAADGKTKLLLDFSGNEGGDVVPGFNLFKNLFPGQPIHSATRFRSTELVNVLGRIFSMASSNGDDVEVKTILDPPVVFNQVVGPEQEKNAFTSWENLFGPDELIKDDKMSNAYAVVNLDAASTDRDPISGYGAIPLEPSEPLFKPDNMLVVTDGRCASTCAIVVGLLQAQGVRTVAFGGRPRRRPMQAVGGVKGGQRWSLRTISRHIQTARKLVERERDRAVAADSESRRTKVEWLGRRLDALAPPSLAPVARAQDEDPLEWEFALRFDTYGQSAVNFRNAYSPGNETIPLQFIYEAADCRLFFTLQNIFEPASRWVAAARAMFDNDETSPRCVHSST